MTVTLMMAIITVSTGQQEVDALAFKTKAKCEQSIDAIKKEVLKVAKSAELKCVERELY